MEEVTVVLVAAVFLAGSMESSNSNTYNKI